MRIILVTLAFLLGSFASSSARNVMSWVPVYGIDNCKALMNNEITSEWLKNGLTHIGLQFWVPGDNGEVVFVTDYQFTYKAATIDQDVKDFVSWGNTNNVKVMLCLYNARSSDFDWTYTREVINNYPNETVANIMSVVTSYGLAGVDIDFEGVGDYSSDKTAFVDFLNKLGSALHAEGKELSVDMFSTPCYNAPNPSWESAMAPYVDFMNVMGYTDTYEASTTLFNYCPQDPGEVNVYAFRYSYIENYLTEKQGVASSKLNYGLPGWVADWGGQCAQENILDILSISSAGGIAIWDLQLSVGIWKEAVTWDIITMFKNNNTSGEIRSDFPICGVTTDIELKQDVVSPVFYNSSQQRIELSNTEGDLYLYSTLGILVNSWNVTAGENITLHEGMSNGIYIIKYRTKTGVFNQRIYFNK